MCTVCGCSTDGATESHHHHHDHRDHGGHHHHHDHEHHHHHGDNGALDYGGGAAGVHVGGLSQKRLVEIETDILAKNNGLAARNRARLEAIAVLALNLVSSPGSGKTTLLVETIRRMEENDVAVIEGDQQTDNDARRIRQTGAPAIQVNTGKGCHLDASMVEHAMDHLPLADRGILFIENVGNLVCPAGFDLGEDAKVAILSVTEGEDKPLKYPHMFAAASLMLLNKIDLAPHVDFDMDRCEEYARRVNPDLRVIRISARSGEGMQEWLDWIAGRRETLRKRAIADAQERLARLTGAAVTSPD